MTTFASPQWSLLVGSFVAVERHSPGIPYPLEASRSSARAACAWHALRLDAGRCWAVPPPAPPVVSLGGARSASRSDQDVGTSREGQGESHTQLAGGGRGAGGGPHVSHERSACHRRGDIPLDQCDAPRYTPQSTVRRLRAKIEIQITRVCVKNEYPA